MKKNKFILTGALAFLSCGMLASCDYSNFSLFGFFYNLHIGTSSSSEVTTFAPQTYLTTSTEKLSNGDSIERYDLLVLLSDKKAALNSYKKYVPASGADSYTNSSFASLTDYTRTDNLVTLDFGPMTYTDRTETNNVKFYRGDDETGSKEAFNKAFDTEKASFVVSKDGTFALGTSSTGDLATGLSTANTYWYYEETSRPSYYMLTLLDDSTYYLNTFCMDSKNVKTPVSAFVTSGTYKSYPDKKTDTYDVVRINIGRGHMFANNNGSNMEFDVNSDDNFKQWLGMSIGKVQAYKVTKVGFEGLLGDVQAYGFEAFGEDFDSDTPAEVDPTDGAMLVSNGQTNQAIKLAFFSDGTYHFVWNANKIDETGTWAYDQDTDVVTLTATNDTTTKTNTITKQEDGTYKVDYVSALSEQLKQTFVISEADFVNNFKAAVILDLKGDKNSAITLTFKSDHTYIFAFTTNNTTESGTWSYDATTDTLSMKVGDKECATVTNNGTYDLHYVYSKSDQLDQHYTLTKAQWGKTFVHSLTTIQGEKMKENCTLTFNSDATFNFYFKVSNNGTDSIVKEDGSYEVNSDDNVVLKVGDATVATAEKQSDGRYKFAYVYSKSSQLTQDFIMDENSYKSTFSIADKTINGVKNPTQVNLKLNRDHSYSFNFNFSGSWQSEYGSWSYDSTNDKLVLTCKTTTNELTKQEDGTYKGTYTANINSKLSQEFVLAAEDTDVFASTLANVDKTNESGTHFGLIFNSNHSYSFHFYNYKVEETGTWSYDSTTDVFTFYCYNTTNTSTKNEDGTYTINYVSHRSSQMTQVFTLSAADAATVIAKA